jgi:hypothetical protein
VPQQPQPRASSSSPTAIANDQRQYAPLFEFGRNDTTRGVFGNAVRDGESKQNERKKEKKLNISLSFRLIVECQR